MVRLHIFPIFSFLAKMLSFLLQKRQHLHKTQDLDQSKLNALIAKCILFKGASMGLALFSRQLLYISLNHILKTNKIIVPKLDQSKLNALGVQILKL